MAEEQKAYANLRLALKEAKRIGGQTKSDAARWFWRKKLDGPRISETRVKLRTMGNEGGPAHSTQVFGHLACGFLDHL